MKPIGRVRSIVLMLTVLLVVVSGGVNAQRGYKFGTYQGKPYDGVTINVAMVAEPRADAIKALLPEFTKLTGIRVVLDILPYPTLQEKQAVALAQHTGAYDVVHVDCVWVGQYAGQGWVVPLTDYIKQTDPRTLALDDFLPLVLKEQGSWQGTVYGLPFIQAVMGLYYRTDIFKKYGLTVPNTWDELREVAKFITEKEKANGIAGVSFAGRRGVQLQCCWDSMLWSFGGKWYDEKYRPTINSPEAVAALEYLISLKPYAPSGVLSYDWDENTAAFAQGKAAMAIQWQNAAPQFADPAKSRVVGLWNFAEIPGVRQPDGSIRRTPTFGGWSLMIPKDAKNKEAAWEFIVWATSKEAEVKLAESGAGSRRSSLSNPALAAKYIEYDAMLKSLEVAMARPSIPAYSELADAIEVALSQAMAGGKSAQAALNEANMRMEMVLRSGGYLK